MLKQETEWVWDARWGNFWIYEKELSEYKESDYFQITKKLSALGINAVTTQGGFHMRWDYIHEWPRLLNVLAHLCKACHKYNIKVVEHHSANLVSFPVGAKEWEQCKIRRRINLTDHPLFHQRLKDGDMIYKGVRLSSMFQIDPRNGRFSTTQYSGFTVLCHNNPDYHKIYFDHLADIYKCGVDGIMTDDIAFFPRDYGCGCLYCRKKFNNDTGYEMPPTGLDDKDFYCNLENPAYRAWILWRIECHKEHQQRVFKHFRSLGLELARPIYLSSNTNAFAPRGNGSSLDNLDGLYSTVYTEVYELMPQVHSWLNIGAESKQKSSLADRNNVPAMCLFYPNNKEENLFCWAMTKTWGQNYRGSSWNLGLEKEMEMKADTYNFESAHSELYRKPKSIAEAAVLFSARTVWFHDDEDGTPDNIIMSNPASTDCWRGWCEMLMLENVIFDVIGDDDLAEGKNFERYRLIILPNSVCLSDKEIESLKTFVRNGGKLIVTHQTGLKNETGAPRGKYVLAELVGAEYEKVRRASSAWVKNNEQYPVAIKKYNPGNFPLADFKLAGNTVPIMAEEGGGKQAVIFHNDYGKGSVITFAGKPGRVICVNRHKCFEKGGKRFAEIEFFPDRELLSIMKNMVFYLLGENRQLIPKNLPMGFISGLFRHGNRTVLHVVNAAGALADNGKDIPIPAPLQFPTAERLQGNAKTIELKVKADGENAILRSPDFSGEKQLQCRRDNEYILLFIPAGLIKCYSVIEIK